MGRIRSIHPGLFTDETFVTLSHPCRWFYMGLLTECDDQGVFEWNGVKLKMRLAPADNDVAAGDLLDELGRADKVCRFEHDGRHYGAVRNFRRFQRPKKPHRAHPLPPELRTYVGLPATSSEPDPGIKEGGSEPGDDKPPPVPQKGEKSPQMEDGGGRREGGGDPPPLPSGAAPPGARERDAQSHPVDDLRGARETKRAGRTGARLPEEWKLDATDIAFARARGFSEIEIAEIAMRFKTHWTKGPGRNKTHVMWSEAWRNGAGGYTAWQSWVSKETPKGKGHAQTTRRDENAAAAFDALRGARNGQPDPR